jgi:threonine synthase
MICVSTRGIAPPVSFRQAVAAGLAPDGGLYVPSRIDPMPADAWDALRDRSLAEVGTAILEHMAGDEFAPGELAALIGAALNFDAPLVRLSDQLAVLELFHGPTFAFKDVGARALARLIAAVHPAGAQPLTILVATSGDTGGAVAHAFHGVAGTRVVVLYPDGQVSAVQEAQFTTLGGNVTAVAVQGSFDDCQGLAKAAFADAALRERVRLTSANSISLGRLLPQISYYAHAVLQCDAGATPVVVVPSGNFGNLTAGVLAWRLGVRVAHFVAATTVNDTVPRFLATGTLDPRPSVPTLANAMDVGDPSNLERLRWLFGDDLDAMRSLITASAFTDADIISGIQELHARFGYLADPHTAVAYLGATRSGVPGLALPQHAGPEAPAHPGTRAPAHSGTRAPAHSGTRAPAHSGTRAPAHPGTRAPAHPGTRAPAHPGTRAPAHPRTLFLSTAHPAKFGDTVERAIGKSVHLPPALAEAMARPRLVTRIAPTLAELGLLL